MTSCHGMFRLWTRAIHGGQKPEPITGAIMPPIFATSTEAARQGAGREQGREQGRAQGREQQREQGSDLVFGFQHGLLHLF